MSERVHNVLLLTFARREEELAIRTALIRLYARFPSAGVIAVGTPTTEPVLHDLGVEQVLVYGNGKSARRIIEEASLCMPEAAVIVYGGQTYGGHLKLEALALLSGPRTILRCRLGRDPGAIGRLRLAFIVLGKAIAMGLRFALAGALGAVACAVLCWSGRRGGRGASRP